MYRILSRIKSRWKELILFISPSFSRIKLSLEGILYSILTEKWDVYSRFIILVRHISLDKVENHSIFESSIFIYRGKARSMDPPKTRDTIQPGETKKPQWSKHRDLHLSLVKIIKRKDWTLASNFNFCFLTLSYVRCIVRIVLHVFFKNNKHTKV